MIRTCPFPSYLPLYLSPPLRSPVPRRVSARPLWSVSVHLPHKCPLSSIPRRLQYDAAARSLSRAFSSPPRSPCRIIHPSALSVNDLGHHIECPIVLKSFGRFCSPTSLSLSPPRYPALSRFRHRAHYHCNALPLSAYHILPTSIHTVTNPHPLLSHCPKYHAVAHPYQARRRSRSTSPRPRRTYFPLTRIIRPHKSSHEQLSRKFSAQSRFTMAEFPPRKFTGTADHWALPISGPLVPVSIPTCDNRPSRADRFHSLPPDAIPHELTTSTRPTDKTHPRSFPPVT